MIIDINKIKRSGADKESFFFLYEPTENLSTIVNVSIKTPVKVSGVAVLTGEHSAYLEGEVCFVLKGQCTRCLDETEKQFVFPFREEAGVDGGYKVLHDEIDISEMVNDTILTNMPVQFLCSEDCKGICCGCGVNLNKSACKCQNKGE